MASITIRPLKDDLPFGVRITGVTAEALADESVGRELNDVFDDRGIIVFEGVEPGDEMQLTISDVFGPLKQHPVRHLTKHTKENQLGLSEISSNARMCIVEIEGEPRINWQPWHFDHCYNDELNRGGVLRSVTIPPEGGMTFFADGVQIHDDLSQALRDEIAELNIVYHLDVGFMNAKFGLPDTFRMLRPANTDTHEVAKRFPRAIHPAVWTRSTGERVVHISPYMAVGIEGREDAAGDARFRELWTEIQRVMRPYGHSWKPTDMIIWDNWRMLHEADGCDPKFERVMRRTTIKGDYGLGSFENGATIAAAEPALY